LGDLRSLDEERCSNYTEHCSTVNIDVQGARVEQRQRPTPDKRATVAFAQPSTGGGSRSLWFDPPTDDQDRRPRLTRDRVVAEALLAAGFTDREAGLAFFLLVDYTIGFAVGGTPTSVNERRVRDPAVRTQLHEFFRSLPPERFPALVAVGQHVWVDNRDERFSAGLDVLIAGLEHARDSPTAEEGRA
jgi:Tetracyclin repressor-like, C-terminal domain